MYDAYSATPEGAYISRLVLLQREYMKPLSDCREVHLYLRGGDWEYVVAYDGMFPVAIIMPTILTGPELMNKAECLASLCREEMNRINMSVEAVAEYSVDPETGEII